MTRFRTLFISILLILFLIPSIAPARSKTFRSGHVRGTAFMTFQNFKVGSRGYSFILRNGSTNKKTEFYILVNGHDFSGKTVLYKRLYIPFLAGNEKKPLFIRGRNNKVSQFSLEYEEVPARDVRIIND